MLERQPSFMITTPPVVDRGERRTGLIVMSEPSTATPPSTLALLCTLLCAGCPGQNGDGGQGTESETGDPTVGSADSTAGENQAPPVPNLVSPVDGAIEIPIGTELCWELVEDPVRYRVFVDDSELTEGKLGEEGHAGPCLGPLNFNHDQVYSWQVQAFDPDELDRQSERSLASSFRTTPDGLTTTVFTGQNPSGLATEADVQGGTTTLTSPPFDLGGFAAATVTLSRFVYKSNDPETGTLFRVELLVPDEDLPEGFRVFVLEQLEEPEDWPTPTNMWTPVEYAGCASIPRPPTRARPIS